MNIPTTDDASLPADIRLRCPRCGTGIREADCTGCGFSIIVAGGIVRALSPESRVRHAGFVQQYERIRKAEGRGSESAEFYLGLPYGGGALADPVQWQVRARSHEYVLRRLFPARVPHRGLVLDLGAGNCWMSHRLALAGYRPCAVDLLANDSDGMGAARHYRAQLAEMFPRFQASFGELPFADDQFDAAIFNASFHYSDNAGAALHEALRCVKPGGPVIISDTPWYPREEDGRRMIAEREARFLRKYASSGGDQAALLGFLTDAWLLDMERALSIRWEMHRPWYGLSWAMRPMVARLRRRRRPSRFRLWVARRHA